MRDTDASLAADTFGPPRVKDGDHEMQRLKMELLKIKCELEQTRSAYKQTKEESRKLKRLLQDKQQQNSTEQAQRSTLEAGNKKGGTPEVHQKINTQTRTCRCKVLEDEVASLHTVLELRLAELRDLRRQCAVAEQDAKQLPVVLNTNSALKLRIVCLEAELAKKSSAEQTLIEEKKILLSSIQYESEQKRRLSLCNEELQWKLRHTSSSDYKSSPLPKPVAQSSPTVQGDISHQQCLLQRSQKMLTPSTKENLLPQSPQIYGIVEKEDSVSWIIDMKQFHEEDSTSTRPVRRRINFYKTMSAKPPKSSSDTLKKLKKCPTLRPINKTKLLR